MPQIEQIQPVYWGALRPDPIDLATDGINVATGPNGSGKTTLLDAIKLSLGVDELGGRRPEEYIFDGGGDAARRADRALIKVVFSNPVKPGKKDRVFADAGRGCEASDYVTAICEVTRGNRVRYAIHPGYVQWGGDNRSIEEDIHKLRQAIPEKHWMGKRKWSELLARAGVSRELLGVLALKQGETDKVLAGNYHELLRKMLELTGKQDTLERFNEAKVQLATAKAAHDQTMQKLEGERRHLQTLELRAQQHEDYVASLVRRTQIETIELPLARRAALLGERERASRERTTLSDNLETTRSDLEAATAEIEKLETDAAAAGSCQQELATASNAAQQTMREASEALGVARTRLQEARDAIERAGEPLTADAVADAERAAATLERELADLQSEQTRLEQEIADLEAGRPPRPRDLDNFRALLTEQGISAELIAERLDADNPALAEAVLGEYVWTLVVSADRFDEVVAQAVEHGYRLPIAAVGAAEQPKGVLGSTSGLPEAAAFLHEVDLPLDAVPGVSGEGVVRGRAWAWFRRPAQPVLGSAAREEAIAARRERLQAIAIQIPDLTERSRTSRETASRKRVGLDAALQLEDLTRAYEQAETEAGAASEAASALTEQLRLCAGEVSRLDATLKAKREKVGQVEESERNLARNLRIQEARIVEIDRQLVAIVIPEGADGNAAVDSVEVLEHDLARLTEELVDERRFPEEVRGELVLARRENQSRTVAEVEEMVEGRQKDLEAVEREVDRAKERYERHIREVVNLLGRRFREVCAQAQMEGEIEIVPSEIEGEFGIDVKVAHVIGEPKRSYRNKAHSTGQKAKISILLLLAAMGLEGAADLLIMDEHSAHLDSRNIDDVAAAMQALSSRVQFLLATPNNEEAKRLHWADHQLAFYPRMAGEPFAPPVVLMTRLPEDQRRYLEIGQMSIAG